MLSTNRQKSLEGTWRIFNRPECPPLLRGRKPDCHAAIVVESSKAAGLGSCRARGFDRQSLRNPDGYRSYSFCRQVGFFRRSGSARDPLWNHRWFASPAAKAMDHASDMGNAMTYSEKSKLKTNVVRLWNHRLPHLQEEMGRPDRLFCLGLREGAGA